MQESRKGKISIIKYSNLKLHSSHIITVISNTLICKPSHMIEVVKKENMIQSLKKFSKVHLPLQISELFAHLYIWKY